MKNRLGAQRDRDPKARKVWTCLDPSGYEVLTPWAKKERVIRRKARAVAKQARKVNRRFKATGGKK